MWVCKCGCAGPWVSCTTTACKRAATGSGQLGLVWRRPPLFLIHLTSPPPHASALLPFCVPADDKHGNGADTYLHRVGRAGRFGTKGLAITFVASPADSEVLNQVQVRLGCVCLFFWGGGGALWAKRGTGCGRWEWDDG